MPTSVWMWKGRGKGGALQLVGLGFWPGSTCIGLLELPGPCLENGGPKGPTMGGVREQCMSLRKDLLAFTVVVCNCPLGTFPRMATDTPAQVDREPVLCPGQRLVLGSPPSGPAPPEHLRMLPPPLYAHPPSRPPPTIWQLNPGGKRAPWCSPRNLVHIWLSPCHTALTLTHKVDLRATRAPGGLGPCEQALGPVPGAKPTLG